MVKIVKKATRFILVSIVGLIAILSLGTVLFIKSGIPHNTIREITEKELTKLFGWGVTIEDLKGSLLSDVEATNVVLKGHPLFGEVEFVRIASIKVYYNLLEVMSSGGDFAKGAKIISMKGVDFHILRTADDDWTLFHIFPPPPPGQDPQPPTFRGEVLMKDIFVSFVDEKGWGQTPLETPFRDTFIMEKGSMNFRHLDHTKLDFYGQFERTQEPLQFKGEFNALNGQFEYTFFGRPDANHWASYVFPLEGWALKDSLIPLQGHMRSKPNPPPNQTPFWYSMSFSVNQAQLTLPFFEDPISPLTAHFTMQHGRILPIDFSTIGTGVSPDLSQTIWTLLQSEGLLSLSGDILPDPDNKLSQLFTKHPRLHPHKTLILGIFETPPAHLFIPQFTGTLGDIPLDGKGTLWVSHDRLSMIIRQEAFDSRQLKPLFSAIENWRFSGQTEGELTLSGRMSNPVIQGNLLLNDAEFYAFSPKNVTFNYTLHWGTKG